MDNTIGSLAKLADDLWLGDAVNKHVAGECLDIFKVYIVSLMSDDCPTADSGGRQYGVSNYRKSLEFTKYCPSSWLRKCSTTTSTRRRDTQGFKGSTQQSWLLGSHFAPVTYALIPADCESSDAYKQAWNGTKAAARLPWRGRALEVQGHRRSPGGDNVVCRRFFGG